MDVSLNTYVRYKQLQKTFTTWLIGAAEEYGEKVGTLSKSDQEKGRQLPLDEHVRLATAIAAKARVPKDKLDILDHVINLRECVARWLKSLPRTGQDDDVHDAQHLHFIGTLKDVRNILSPACTAYAAAPTPSKSESTVDSDSVYSTANRFEALTVEEPENININDWAKQSMRSRILNSSSDAQSKSEKKTKKKKKRKQEGYSMESTHVDILFAWVCFFMDFNEMLRTVRRIWSLYDASSISLVNASLLTNTAMEMIRTNCHTQWRAMEGLPFTPDEEDKVVPWVFAHLAGYTTDDRQPRSHAELQLAEWCCYHTWSILRAHMEGAQPGQFLLFSPTTGEGWDERELQQTVQRPGTKRYNNDFSLVSGSVL